MVSHYKRTSAFSKFELQISAINLFGMGGQGSTISFRSESKIPFEI